MVKRVALQKKKKKDGTPVGSSLRNSSTGEIPNSQSNLVEHMYRQSRWFLYRALGTGWALIQWVPCGGYNAWPIGVLATPRRSQPMNFASVRKLCT